MINVDDRLVKEELPKMGVDAFAVLMVITSHINNTRRAWPGIKKIREVTKLSRERAYKAISTLIDLKHVERTQENANGEWGMVVYRVTSQYLGVFVPASSVELPAKEKDEPLYGKPEYGKPCDGKPEYGKATHISINQKRSIKKKEVLRRRKSHTPPAHEEKQKTPQPEPEFQTYEVAYNHLVEYFKANPHLINGIKTASGFSGPVSEVLKDYLIHMQQGGEWFKLQVPTDSGAHFRWVAEIQAGVTKWCKVRKNSAKGGSKQVAQADAPKYTPPPRIVTVQPAYKPTPEDVEYFKTLRANNPIRR